MVNGASSSAQEIETPIRVSDCIWIIQAGFIVNLEKPFFLMVHGLRDWDYVMFFNVDK